MSTQEFEDWFYREYKSTPDRVRRYQQTCVENLMRAAYEAGKQSIGHSINQSIGQMTEMGDRNEGMK